MSGVSWTEEMIYWFCMYIYKKNILYIYSYYLFICVESPRPNELNDF